MADTITSKEYNGTGSQNTFVYTFQSYQKEDVKVEIDGNEQTQGTHYQIDSYTAAGGTINFQVGGAAATYYNGSSTVTASPPSGTKNIRVYRDTDISTGSVGVHEPKATYVAGSSIKSADLNNNAKQALYATFELKDQEVQTTDIADGAVTRDKIKDDAVNGSKIADDSIDSEHYVADSIDTEHYAPNSVDTTALAADAVTGAQLADNSVDSEHYVNGSIDTEHYAANSVDTTALGPDAVTGAQLADNAVDSEHITAGSIDTVHLTTGSVTNSILAADSVDSSKIVDGSIVNADINNNAAITISKLENLDSGKIIVGNDSNRPTEVAVSGDVTISHTGAVTIAAGAVENGMMANNSVASGNIVNDTIQNTDINTGAAIEFTKLENLDSAKILVGNASNKATEVAMSGDATIDNAGAVTIATGAVEHAMLANDVVDGDNIQDDAIASEHIADAAVQNDHIAAATIQGGKIATGAISATQLGTDSVTVAKIDNAQLTTLSGMQSGTASVLADSTALTSTTAELNLLDGKSIVTTISSPTDVQLPTAQAVEERIVDLVTDVGGFRPIANETSFPATNPDPGDNAGTIVSVKALASNLTSNGSGVATIANGAGSGNTVTINGMANSDTIEAGKGILVETTSTLHTYTFHRETLAPADITAAQSAVTDFNGRYRILASGTDISTVGSLDDGDLLWDSNVDKMKVYDATASSWKEVTSSGDYKYLFLCPTGGTGTPTYGGASYDLREGSASGDAADVTTAAQLIVSINGVIQKANTGTSAPSEGFAMVDGNSIIFGANIASTDSVFIVQIGSAISIPTPGDGTVSTAKIQNLAVDNDKIANDTIKEAKLDVSNAPTNGQFLQAQSGEGGGLTWATVSTDVVSDTTPQLGGNLDVQDKVITTDTGTNTDITIKPKGTGDLQVGPGDAEGTISANGAYNLRIKANASGTSGANINLVSGANGGIDLIPVGTGFVQVSGQKLKISGSGAQGHVTTSAGQSAHLHLNTNEGTDSGEIEIEDAANGDIKITPNGTGDVVIDGLKYPQADGSSGQFLKTDGSAQLSWATVSAGTALTGSTDNTVCTVTGADAIQGEANLKFDGTELTLAADRSNTAGTGHISIAPGDTTSIWTIRHDSTGNDLWFDRGTSSSSTAYVGFSHDGNIKLTSGKGIDFSATADAGGMSNELLDDYEEGTWTPALTYGGAAVGLNTPVGTYVKVGNLICCRCRMQTTDNPSGANVNVSGLPYSSNNPANDGNAITGAVYMESCDSGITTGYPMAFGFDASSNFDIRMSGTTGSGTSQVSDAAKTGTSYMTTVVYQTA